MKLNSIINETHTKSVVQKSKFLSYAFFCSNLFEQNKILKKLRNEHFSASHICFASIFETESFSSDDGEPSGTAGTKILSAMKEKNLINVLCVVVRYFGGEKLGTSRLGKTYNNCAKSCLENNLKIVEKKTLYSSECPYNIFEFVQNFFQKSKIQPENIIFGKEVKFKVFLNQTEKDFLENSVTLTNNNISKFC